MPKVQVFFAFAKLQIWRSFSDFLTSQKDIKKTKNGNENQNKGMKK